MRKNSLLPFNSELILQQFPPLPEQPQPQQYNITIGLTTPPEATVTYTGLDGSYQVVLTPKNTSEVQQLLQRAKEATGLGPIIVEKMGKATKRAMAGSTIQNVTNTELLDLNRRNKQKASRAKGNHGVARFLGKDEVDERKEMLHQKDWKQEVIALGRMCHIFPTKQAAAKAVSKAASKVASAGARALSQEEKTLLHIGLDIFPEPPTPCPPTPRKPPSTPRKRTSKVASAVARALPQQQQQRLVVKLCIRITSMDLEGGLGRRRGGRLHEHTERSQEDHVIAGTGPIRKRHTC